MAGPGVWRSQLYFHCQFTITNVYIDEFVWWQTSHGGPKMESVDFFFVSRLFFGVHTDSCNDGMFLVLWPRRRFVDPCVRVYIYTCVCDLQKWQLLMDRHTTTYNWYLYT